MVTSNSGGEDKRNTLSIDRLIHEPARYTIMAYLYVVESADFLFLVKQTGLTWGNLSAHVGKLEAAGYVEIKKEFLGKKPHTVASLTQEGRLAFEAYRREIMQVLDELPPSR
jgi:DNA-binding MarR family transcriptional regulator